MKELIRVDAPIVPSIIREAFVEFSLKTETTDDGLRYIVYGVVDDAIDPDSFIEICPEMEVEHLAVI